MKTKDLQSFLKMNDMLFLLMAVNQDIVEED
jgi:hypothetical protein